MPIDIQGQDYHTVAEVLEAASISRQTLWRWRQERRVPQGHRFRDGQVLFSGAELSAVLKYATHLVPIGGDARQLALFQGERVAAGPAPGHKLKEGRKR
jgi:predicted DNA-binding transcriptional regulator AlpA